MKNIFLGLSLLLSFCLRAQDTDPTVETIDINAAKDFAWYARELIEKPNGEKVFVCDGHERIVFYTVDSDNNLVDQKKYELKEKSDLIAVFTYKDKVYILYRELHKKLSYIYAATADITTLNFTAKKLITAEMGYIQELADIDINYTSTRMMEGVSNSFAVTKDRSAFAICMQGGDNKTPHTERKLIIYNTEKLESVLEHSFKDKEDEKFVYHYNAFTLTDDGKTAILLAEITIRPGNIFSTKTEGYSNYYRHFEINRLTASGLERKILSDSKHFARRLGFIDYGDHTVITGVYSEKDVNNYVKGICFFDIDNNAFSIKTSRYIPFSPQFNIDVNGKNKAGKVVMPALIKALYTDSNEDIWFVFEERSINVSNPNGYRGRGGTFYYEYGGLTAGKIDKAGNLSWVRYLDKDQNQIIGHRYHLSFSTLFKDDTLHVFLNAEKIKDKKTGGIEIITAKDEDADLIALQFDAKGNYTYETLLDHKEAKSYIHPFVGAKPESENSIYFYASKRKQHPTGKVDTYQEIYKIKP